MDIISKFNYLYSKQSFFQKYGIQLIISTLIIFFFLIVTGYFYTLSHLRTLRKDWPQNKCNPMYMPFAGIIADNPNESKLETTAKNYNFCINNILSSTISTFLEPIYYLVKLLIDSWTELITAIRNIRSMFNNMRNTTTNFTTDVMNRNLNVATNFSHNIILARDTLNKTNGVLAAGLLQVFGTYLTLRGLVAAIIDLLIILILVPLAAATLALYAAIPITFGASLPPALAGTAFFLAISVPLAIVIAIIGSALKVKPTHKMPKTPRRH